MTLRTLSLPVRVLFSCFLLTTGMGYLFAVLYLFLIDVEPHAKQGVGMVQSVIVKYYGQRGGTKLEAALDGTMGDNVTPAQKRQIITWISRGAKEEDFGSVQSLFLEQCATCHGKESGLPISPLTTYEEVTAYIQMDMGESIKRLVKVSHIHIFGMSFIFILTGGIFAFSEVSPGWRAVLIAIPFAAVWIDIGSWWFTKVEPLFAYTVIIGGILMGLSLAAQIVLSLYEMWIKAEPQSHG
jgi:hypothetical protein